MAVCLITFPLVIGQITVKYKREYVHLNLSMQVLLFDVHQVKNLLDRVTIKIHDFFMRWSEFKQIELWFMTW